MVICWVTFVLQEVIVTPSKPIFNQSVNLPDYEYEPSTVSEQKRYVLSQLLAQLELASAVCLESPFFGILRKRLLVAHRIFYAIHTKFHDKSDEVRRERERL
jgi:hypothetical protein